MKCKTCKKSMTDILIDFDYKHGGTSKKAVNVPARQCPLCNDITVPNMVLERLKGFAVRERENVVDFAKSQQQEEDDFIVLNMLGIM